MDPKKILGVEPNATLEEIQRAYREKVKKHHPDMGGDGWAFQQVQAAYEALTKSKPAGVQSPGRQTPAAARTQARQSTHESTFDDSKSRASRQANSSTRTSSSFSNKSKRDRHSEHNWQNLFFGQLPLQTETTTFILVNCLDIFLTNMLLRNGAIEANPIANFVMLQWGFPGAIAFKLAIVAAVAVIAQIVAIKKPATARFLLIAGTMLVGCVVVYSVFLFMKHFGGL